MEYAVASGVVRDRVGLATFDADAVDDPAVQRVRERVEFAVDASLPYDSHEAVVRLVTGDGAFERRQADPPGTHDNPLSESELRAKFEECAGRVLSPERVEELYERLARLESLRNPASALADGV